MKKHISILMIIATVLFSGCSEDFLERESLTALSTDTFWSSKADVDMALAGCYSSLQDRYIYDSNPWAAGVVRWDYMTDDGWVRWGWMAGGDMSRGENSTASWITGDTWKAFYRAIVRCNRVIETVPTLEEGIISDTYAKQAVAEAKFIRALVYNLFTMTYEDVPLVTSIQPIEEADIAKSPKSDIVNFIISDMEASVEDLADNADWGRATKGAGYALLARINLYNENWTETADWSQKVMDQGYSLFNDFHGLFQNADEVNNEVIFPVRFLRGPDENGASFAAYWGEGFINYQEVLPGLAEDYFSIDGMPWKLSPGYNPDIPSENRDPRFDASIVSVGSTWRDNLLNKPWKIWTHTAYAQRKYTEEQNSEDHFDADEDFYVFRLGEVLLMRAEALAEMGGAPDDIFSLINQLRDRIDMVHVDQTTVDDYFNGDIIEMVRHERRVETAFEGLRYIDIKRWGIFKERAIDFYMDNEAANNSKLSHRMWQGEKQIKWPIPQSEVDVNELLEQHDIWN